MLKRDSKTAPEHTGKASTKGRKNKPTMKNEGRKGMEGREGC